MNLKFEILGIPFSKQSFRFAVVQGHVKKYQETDIIKEENNVRQQVISQLPEEFIPINEPLAIIKCWFVFPPLSNFSKKKLRALENGEIIYKETRPDLVDNLFKGLMDAMEGIVFTNDSRIVSQNNVKKFYGLRPGIWIEFETIEDRK